MSCSVAVSNSPVFSPSSSLFCNKTSIISPSPETLTLPLTHVKFSPSSSLSPTSSSSPSSPFRFRLQKPPTGLSSSSACVSSSSSPLATGPVSGPSSGSPQTILKRKRPAKLDIPVASMSFGSLVTPREVRRDEVEEGRDEYYSVYCKRGRREAMEDRYSAVIDIQGDPKQAFFGIFDGHGGAKAAEYAAENLDKNILHEILRRDEDEIEDAVKHGYLNTDSEFLKEDFRGGSCCVTALIRKGTLVISNAGDCRAVMSRGGLAEALTSDHRPAREDEKNRIENMGGYVDLCRGTWRVQGSLAVSRGIGDRHLKQWVIADPETKIIRLKPEYEFLILASDGLWDKVSNQEAVDIARPFCRGVAAPEPMLACKKLVDLSVSRGSVDDVSVMVIQLKRYI
ncbi:Protein phosphatase 2C family protein [Melia azedarach]|uniref:Protein phosphatase 2C family protein n=1 Tax=Melia azedarach TaxID=155640 RepID=A0ACC1YP40_MELAZ|nr:Protein phosphatase 2C family protein [Melia azedarach]